MKIEISVQEYFNELKLMEKHYGQEEDLYPWIYMLLQMAEGKKQDILKDRYSKVSIRDVHNGQYYSWGKNRDKDNWKIRWELYKNVGVPDFAIINTNNKVIGCVEVKKTKDELFTTEPDLEYTYIKEDDDEKFKYYGDDSEFDGFISGLLKKGYTVQKDGEENNTHFIKVGVNIAEKVLKKYGINLKPITGVIYKNNPLPTMLEVSISRGPIEKPNNQVLGHLFKFGKVIYTNGLKFYLLTVKTISKENNGEKVKFNVIELANLTDLYEKYRDSNMNGSSLILLEKQAVAEWDKLIAGLTKINWLEEPTTPISEDSK